MELKITTLIENEQDDCGELHYEHGLSLYIEFNGKKILFDTGQTGAFADNAKKLGKELQDVDFVIVSHGHYDHSGGVMRLAKEIGKETRLYIGEEFFDRKYKKIEDAENDKYYKYNGNPFSEEELEETYLKVHRITDDITWLDDKIVIFKNFKQCNSFEKTNPKFFVECAENIPQSSNENLTQDFFNDEVVLGLVTEKGLVVVAGCSHIGIVNILSNIIERVDIPVYSVLGGTHLVEADEYRLEYTAEAFRKMKLQQIAVSHCTGEQGIEVIRREFGEKFIRNNTGNIYEV